MNDFVNPQHRGVNLPAGYKDLMDLLVAKKPQSVTPETYSPFKIERIPSEGLMHVEKHLRCFLTYPAVRPGPLLDISTTRGSALLLFRSKKGPHAILTAPDTAVEKLVREIISNVGINPISVGVAAGENVTAIQCVLPAQLPELLRIVTTLLRDAYGITAASGLSFIYRD